MNSNCRPSSCSSFRQASIVLVPLNASLLGAWTMIGFFLAGISGEHPSGSNVLTGAKSGEKHSEQCAEQLTTASAYNVLMHSL